MVSVQHCMYVLNTVHSSCSKRLLSQKMGSCTCTLLATAHVQAVEFKNWQHIESTRRGIVGWEGPTCVCTRNARASTQLMCGGHICGHNFMRVVMGGLQVWRSPSTKRKRREECLLTSDTAEKLHTQSTSCSPAYLPAESITHDL